jgi:hypothetical protein
MRLNSFASLALAIVASCTATDAESPEPCVASLSARPLLVGDTARFVIGSFKTSDCLPDGDTTFAWSSLDSTVATITRNGVARGVAPGVFRVQAIRGSDVVRSEGFVLPPGWEPRIEPESVTVEVGDSVSFRVLAYDREGDSLPTVPFWLLTEEFLLARSPDSARRARHQELTEGRIYQYVMLPGYFRGTRPGRTVITGQIADRRVEARLTILPKSGARP